MPSMDKVSLIFGLQSNFQLTAQSRQPPNWRKLAQSGHPRVGPGSVVSSSNWELMGREIEPGHVIGWKF
jgi:hypothetical protein